MKDLHIEIPEAPDSLYLRVSHGIRESIAQGHCKPGEQLPSSRRLAELVGCHRSTVLLALAELVAEGWLVSEPRRGFRVPDALPDSTNLDHAQEVVDLPPSELEVAWSPCPRGGDHWTTERDTDIPIVRYYLGGGPDLREFPRKDFYRCIRRVIEECKPGELLRYGNPAGECVLRELVEGHIRRRRGITVGGLTLTNGAQEALYLVARLFLSTGAAVAVEDVGYPPAWEAFRLAGGRLCPVEVDSQGLVVESFEKCIQQHKPKLLFLTPLHQYPTTTTLTSQRRQAIYELCVRNKIAIIEDDYDHEFYFSSAPPATMKARDPCQIIFYISTFSKLTYPSLRIGLLISPERYIGALLSMKKALNYQVDRVSQRALALWIEEGGLERHVNKTRKLYLRRRDQMVSILARGDLSFEVPNGGMNIWINFKVDSSELAKRCLARGVWFAPGSYYQLTKSPTTWTRLGYAGANLEEQREALDILFEEHRRL